MSLEIMGQKAKAAARTAARLSQTEINLALSAMADALEENSEEILAENQKDILAAQENGIREIMIDRLLLTEERIHQIAQGVREVAALKSPVGEIRDMRRMENGLQIGKMRVPIGVIAIIYESRPNVTADCAALCLKTGNAVILRGGKEAIHSNIAITKTIQKALERTSVTPNAVQLVTDTSRETAQQLMKLNRYVDVLIPRGGAGLIRTVVENATVSVIETGTGNCHIYADDGCDFSMATEIVYNAKTQRPSVCNAAESLLIHKNIAEKLLPLIWAALKEKNVEFRGCDRTAKIIPCKAAKEEDYYTEFLDYIISVKIVDGLEEAINHINKYGTGHSEAIITNSYENAQRFLREVDSAAVYVNASTRFTDGNAFGLGAEIGISTQKLHARGPMGLEALTSDKYIVLGNGQTR